MLVVTLHIVQTEIGIIENWGNYFLIPVCKTLA